VPADTLGHFCPSRAWSTEHRDKWGLIPDILSKLRRGPDSTDIRGKFDMDMDMDAHNDVIARSQSAPPKGVKPLRCCTTGGSCSWVPRMPSHRPAG